MEFTKNYNMEKIEIKKPEGDCCCDIRRCICKHCGKEFLSYTGNVRYCSDECRDKAKEASKTEAICDVCGTKFMKSPWQKANYCSEKCRVYIKNQKFRKKVIDNRSDELKKGVEGYDYVVCKICGYVCSQLNNSHLMNSHGISVDEYRKMYPDAQLMAQKHIDTYLAVYNNPSSHKNRSDEDIKKNSPFCKEFYEERGLTEDDRRNFINDVNANRDPNSFASTMRYYTSRGYTIEEALRIRKERYGFTMEKAIEKYGEEKGRELFLGRQAKWIESMYGDNKTCYTKSHVSEVSKRFIKDVLEDEIDNEIYKHGKSEFQIKGDYHVYKYDLTNIETKRIIEFNGDLWHGNPLIYEATDKNKVNGVVYKDKWEYDRIKNETAEKEGYEVMIVWEFDYNNFKDKVIQEAKDFIFGKINKC